MKILRVTLIILIAANAGLGQDNALDFDGVNQYVSVDYHAELNPAVFSISFWARVQGGAGTIRSVIASQNTNGVTNGYSIFLNDQDQWEFWIGTASGAEKVIWPVDTFGEWVYLAATFDGTDMLLYANAIKVAELSGLSGFTPNASNPLFIGAAGTAGSESSFFNGQLDEMGIWNIARTETDIRADYLKYISGGDPNLMAYYRIQLNAAETRLLDNTSNASQKHRGTLLNMSAADLVPSSAYSGPHLALSFDGVDDYVDVSNGAYGFTTTEFTQEVWIYPTHEASDNTLRFIFGCDESVPNEQRPPVIAVYAENLYCAFGDNTTYYEFDIPGVIKLNAWNHIAVALSQFGHVVYVDGIEVSDSNIRDKILASTPILYLGKLGNGYFKGLLDEARLWNDWRYFGSVRSKFTRRMVDQSTQIAGLERYWTMDMSGGAVLPEYIQGNHGDLMNYDGTDFWQSSQAFNMWLNTESNSWNDALNWSLGTVPVINDNVGIVTGSITAYPVLDINATVNLVNVDQGMTFTIDNSITLKTNAALYIRNIMINNGTNQIGGVAQFTDATSVYDDNGITEYNGSVTQNIELKNLNNLVIDNTGDSVHSTIDSLFIEGDFTVENGDFKTPFYMSVAGLMTMQTGTNLTIHDFSTLEVTGNVNSQTANDLQVDGFGTTDATLTLKSDIVGNGTFSANSYSISPFTVFGFTDPPTEVFLAAHNWSAGGADNDWNNTDNWSNKKVPGKGTDVTIDPATQEGEYPVISTPDAECKSLTLNPSTQLLINTGGTLDIGKDVRIETSSELTMDNGTMTVDQKQNGFIQITGGTLQLDNSSQVEIGNFIHVLSGGLFILDNSSVSIGANLNIDGSTVTLRNNATGQVNGDIDVNSGSELKLESNANLNIGN